MPAADGDGRNKALNSLGSARNSKDVPRKFNDDTLSTKSTSVRQLLCDDLRLASAFLAASSTSASEGLWPEYFMMCRTIALNASPPMVPSGTKHTMNAETSEHGVAQNIVLALRSGRAYRHKYRTA